MDRPLGNRVEYTVKYFQTTVLEYRGSLLDCIYKPCLCKLIAYYCILLHEQWNHEGNYAIVVKLRKGRLTQCFYID